MLKIEKGSNLYAFYTNCNIFVANIDLCVEHKSHFEVVMTLNCERLDATATVSALVSENAKNNARPVVELKGVLTALENEELDEDFWENLFSSCEFYLTPRAAYYAYCRQQVKLLEAEQRVETPEKSRLAKDALELADFEKNKDDRNFLKRYALRFGLVNKTISDEEFLKEGSCVGDTVFASISLYGLHSFKIASISEKGVYQLEGVNQFTDQKIVFNCVAVGDNFFVCEMLEGQDSSHWYVDIDMPNGAGLPFGMLIRKSAVQATRDSVIRSIVSLKRGIKELKASIEAKEKSQKQLLAVLNQNLQGLNDSIRHTE